MAIQPLVKNPKKCDYEIRILETTIYNYQNLSKLYKEQTMYGECSKLLPQIALGHSQREILATLDFESRVLDISSLMIPVKSSCTMSSDNLDKSNKSNSSNNQNNIEDGKVGRKELADDEKSDKTLRNLEAMS